MGLGYALGLGRHLGLPCARNEGGACERSTPQCRAAFSFFVSISDAADSTPVTAPLTSPLPRQPTTLGRFSGEPGIILSPLPARQGSLPCRPLPRGGAFSGRAVSPDPRMSSDAAQQQVLASFCRHLLPPRPRGGGGGEGNVIASMMHVEPPRPLVTQAWSLAFPQNV